ncbi:unnamed protein product [Nippostrongylus brasiliensis]|uniref:Uncharacterized protein n=1 Tax=Nippostrongylus brasiliensis TaxID=27835 RepID=A0A0N4Y7V6_NIPBR|nr:unnamed protein product [Nippostrongylus brasiliensis]
MAADPWEQRRRGHGNGEDGDGDGEDGDEDEGSSNEEDEERLTVELEWCSVTNLFIEVMHHSGIKLF